MRNIINISLGIIFWGGLHSLLASNKAKFLGKRFLGEAIFKKFRLIYNIFSILSFLPILGLMSHPGDQRLYVISRPWVFVTLIIQIIGLVIIYYSIKQTGIWDFIGWTPHDRKGYDSERTLRTNGMFRIVRHPAYLAGLMILWLSPMMTSYYLTFCIGISIYLLIGVYFEERKLLLEFGEAYHLYQRKVPMLIPGIKWNNRRY